MPASSVSQPAAFPSPVTTPTPSVPTDLMDTSSRGRAGTSRRRNQRNRCCRLLVKSSSWIRSLRYVHVDADDAAALPRGTNGFLIVTTHDGRAYAYAVPRWTAGLLVAAQARGLSVGSAFNVLVKARQYASVKLTEDDN